MPKRNDPCSCGSGKKYKKCCGKNVKEFPIGPQTKEALERQIQKFREKFGRDPEPGDPVFFDPEANEPIPVAEETLTEGLADAMRRAGLPAHFIYAMQKTGMLVTEQNYSQWSKKELKEWEDAINEYLENPERN